MSDIDRSQRKYECCREAAHMEPMETPSAEALTCERCRVCGRRHFILTADAVPFGIEGGRLG